MAILLFRNKVIFIVFRIEIFSRSCNHVSYERRDIHIQKNEISDITFERFPKWIEDGTCKGRSVLVKRTKSHKFSSVLRKSLVLRKLG